MDSAPLLHFVHTPLFDESAEDLLGLDGLRAAQAMIQANPDVGKLIQGTSGARKMRVAIGGRGKSHGARVIYYNCEAPTHVGEQYSRVESAA